MTRIEWLNKEHQKVDKQIQELEAERQVIRDFNHKALLKSLKAQKLKLKTEIARETV